MEQNKERFEKIEGEIKDLWGEVDGLKSGQGTLELNVELMKKDMEYTKKTLDKIDGNVDLLKKARFSDHYEEPLKAERTKKERRISQIENIVFGVVITYIIFQLFPILAR